MSESIDRRVVEMRFDNKDFEKNAEKTLLSLETLRKALEMKDGGKGLENLKSAIGKTDLSGIERGVQSCEDRFSSLGIVGMTVLQELTRTAMDFSKNALGSLLNPIFQGGKQRAANMEQAQFMFAGLGYAEEKIGAVGKTGSIMDNLYKSVDDTFYSLDKAALVGSQLMAAGIDGTSEEITKVLKGVAGVSSMFGADYQRVGEIFTKIKVSDRMMGQELTQLSAYGVPAAAKIAEYLTRVGDGAEVTQAQVQEMASKGEIDFETFSNAMADYGEQAAKSKQLTSGAFEDMQAALARIGEKLWHPVNRGFRDFYNAMVPVIDNISGVLTPAYELFGNVVEKVSDKISSAVDIFGALFNYKNTLSELTRLSADGIDIVDPERVERLKAAFDSGFLKNIKDAVDFVKQMSSIGLKLTFLDKIHVFLASLGSNQKTAGARKAIQDLTDVVDGLHSAFNLLKKAGTTLLNIFSPLGKAAKSLGLVLLSIAGAVGRFLTAIDEGTGQFSGFAGVLKSGVEGVVDAFSKLLDIFVGNFSLPNALKDIGSSFGWLGDMLSKLSFGSFFKGLVKGGIIVAAIDTLRNLQNVLQKFRESGIILGSTGQLFNQARLDLMGLEMTLQSYQKVLQANALLKIAGAILMLAIALKMLSDISGPKLGAATAAITVLFEELSASLMMSKPTVFASSAKGALRFAVAIRILAGAVKELSEVENLGKGIAGISILIGELTALCFVFDRLKIKPRALQKTASGLVIMAIAIKLLAKPVKELGSMETGDLVKGLAALAVMLGEFTLTALAFSKIKTGGIMKAGTAMLVMAVAMRLLAEPLSELGSMNLKSLAKGLGAMGVALLELAGFTAIMGKIAATSGNIMAASAALLVMSVGIKIMAGAISQMGADAGAGQGLSVLFGSLLILGVAMAAMKNSLPGAAAMVIVAGALMLMAPAIAMLSSLDLKGVLVGLGALAGTLIIFGVAATVLGPMIPVMIGLAAAMAILGVGVLSLGAGMTLLVGAFAMATGPIIEGAKAISEAFPIIAKGVGDGIVIIIKTIGDSAEAIKDSFIKVLDAAISAFTDAIPKLVNAGLDLVSGLLKGLQSRIGEITTLAIDVIYRFINALSDGLPKLTTAGVNLMVNFLNSMADAIGKNSSKVSNAFLNVILAVLEVLAGLIPGFGKKAAAAIENYRQGLNSGKDGVSRTASDISNTADTNLQIPSQYSNGYNAVAGLDAGMSDMIGTVQRTASVIAGIVDDTIRKKNQISSPSRLLMKTGSFMMQGLIKGLDSLTGEYEKKADNIATVMISSANRSVRGITDAMNTELASGFSLNSSFARALNVNFAMDGIVDQNSELADKLNRLTDSLDGMTDIMNSRQQNNYITIDGSSDPDAFADTLTRRFKLNARTM